MRDRAAAAAAPEGASCRRGLLTTAEDRGVDDPDWLLIRDIVEDPGLPVRKDRVAGLMRARGSAVTDDQFARMMHQKVNASIAMFDALDIELKPGDGMQDLADVTWYLTWRGMPGYRHRSLNKTPCVNPPDAIGARKVADLQNLLDLHKRVIRARTKHSRSRESWGRADLGRKHENEWAQKFLPALREAKMMAILNHPFCGRNLSGAPTEIELLQRLAELDDAGVIDAYFNDATSVAALNRDG